LQIIAEKACAALLLCVIFRHKWWW